MNIYRVCGSRKQLCMDANCWKALTDTLESVLISLTWKQLWSLLFTASHLDGNLKFLAGGFSILELQSIKMIELDPVVSVFTVGLNIGKLYLWALMSCLAFSVGCFCLSLWNIIISNEVERKYKENWEKTVRRNKCVLSSFLVMYLEV